MSDRLVRTGLLLPAAAAWLVALATTVFPRAAPVLLVIAAGAVVPCVLLARRRHTRVRALLAAGCVVTALVAGASWAGQVARHPGQLALGRSVEVRVQVATAASAATGRSAVRGSIVAVLDGRWDHVDVPVLLFADGSARPVPGSTLEAAVVLQAAPATDEAAVLGSVHGPIRLVATAPPWEAFAQRLRDRFLALSARLPGDGGALLPGLAIGDTSRVGTDLQQAMRNASLTHLTAVSGANCAVVVLLALTLAAWARAPRPVRIVLALMALAGFIVLVTPEPSVVRAAVMTTAGLACVLTGRRTAGPAALAVAVLVMLAADPWIAWSAGFVLSVAATGGLLLLAPPLADRLGRVLPRRLALLLAVPIAAQAACQPVLVLLQPGVPVFGALANLVAEPAVPVATVLGLAACLLAPVLPPLAGGLALLAWLPASWIAGVARVGGALPQLGWAPGLLGALLAALLVALAIAALRRRTAGPLRLAAAATGVLLLLVLAGAAAGAELGRRLGTPTDWTFAACDVGQGDGLVLHGGSRYAVVDTGREPGPILACLDRLGIHRVDLLVLTHWDADHVGGAAAIASRVRTAFVGPPDGAKTIPVLAALRRAHVHIVQVHRGESTSLGPMRLDVLWPPDPLGGVQPGNTACITLHVTGEGPSLLMTGDLDEASQDAILALGPVPHVDVIKVAHHGSADQSPAFYAAASASIGVISVGAGNDYGHPTARLLDILRAVGTQAVRTDQDGMVLIGEHQGWLSVWTERPVTAAVWTPAK